jgi:3-deoxy-7-phosphoheptulonate synthase
MIAILNPACSLREKAQVVSLIEERGLRVHLDRTDGREWVGVLGSNAEAIARELGALPGVEEVRSVKAPYALASRELHPEKSIVAVADVEIGGDRVCVMAGPCAVESEEQIFSIAEIVAQRGARILRGGAFKPRTSPYSFQGLGLEGLKLLAAAGKANGLPIVTEVVAPEDVETVAEYADMLQVGARNMQNFRLLQAAGEVGRPVLLKRGMVATLDELLLAAEYVLDAGTPDVCLCERGIRTFSQETRNTLDLAAIPLLQERSHLPVIADPSHGTGIRRLVGSMARAALAAGADGLIVEVHPDPKAALSDGEQSLTPDGFDAMMLELEGVARAIGRRI